MGCHVLDVAVRTLIYTFSELLLQEIRQLVHLPYKRDSLLKYQITPFNLILETIKSP